MIESSAPRNQGATPLPFGPVPSERQLKWHALEFYGFLHFSVNTFTDLEWGYGDESPGIFDPTNWDADQIAETAHAVGMTGLILTCKHHDGFCLWPSRFTEHSVAKSPWRKGHGDVVKEISEACERHDLQFGIYLSPWDRNHAQYGRVGYLGYYRAQLRELLENYGPLFEVWFDGANGGDGYYGGARERREIDIASYYDWENTWQIVRDLQPNACIFSDAGPDVRWVGNERGVAGETCWATLNRDDFVPGDADRRRLNEGDRSGTSWVPAECDVSIRPGWFYHYRENDCVRTPQELIELYFKSVGRGASLLLNLPPDGRGQIHQSDIRSLQAFRQSLDRTFSVDLARGATSAVATAQTGGTHFGPQNAIDGCSETYWYAGDEVTRPELVLEFERLVQFSVVGLREHLPLGQRVEAFALDAWQDDDWHEFAAGTSIGARRLLRSKDVVTNKVRLRITQAPVCPALGELSLFAESAA